MRIGITLSHDQTRTAAEAAEIESAGFDVVATGEHLFFHGPVSNGLIQLAAAAGATRSIRLLSALTIVPLYQPVLLAKQITTLDQVSQGRFDFGVGVGGEHPPEFEAAGVKVSQRGSRTDEALALFKELWTGEPVTFAGRYATLTGQRLEPGPVQPGGPPIWLGGRQEPAMRRAARYADHWMPYMFTPEQLRESLTQVRELAQAQGRAAEDVSGAIFLWATVDEDGERARQLAIDTVSRMYQQDFSRLADRYLLFGTPEQVVDRIGQYAEAGAEAVIVGPLGVGADRDRTFAGLAEDVLPRLSR